MEKSFKRKMLRIGRTTFLMHSVATSEKIKIGKNAKIVHL